MDGLPITFLDKYGVGVFLVVCTSGFLWYLIRMIGKLVTSFATQISDERKRWEVIVDNHLSELGKSQQNIATSLIESSNILKSITISHAAHSENQATDHSQQSTDHTVMLERLPSRINGRKKRR